MAKSSKKKTKAVSLDDDPIENVDDVEDVDDADADIDAEESEPAKEESVDEPAPPRQKKTGITKTALAFILLNWIAVPTFLWFAYTNHITRSQYAYEALLNHVQIWGLPLEGEEAFPSASNVLRASMQLTPDQVKEACKARTRKTYNDFVAVEEPVPLRLRPSDLRASDILPAPPLRNDIFGELKKAEYGGPVASLEEEINRLVTDVPATIERAVKDEVLAKLKTDEEKRDAARRAVQPISWNGRYVSQLEDRIARAEGPELDKLTDESLQRRLYYDILAPINVFRPGNLAQAQIEKIADQSVPLDTVKDYLIKRLKGSIAASNDPEIHIGEMYAKERTKPEDRDSIEKRQTIAFILFSLAQAQVPTTDKKLYAKGSERAQTISGIREYTGAAIYYVRALRVLEERLTETVVTERQGWPISMKGKDEVTRIPSGFIDVYENEVDRLVKLFDYLDAAQKRLADLRGQRDHLLTVQVQRAAQHKETLDKLLTARRGTRQYRDDLRELETVLHQKLVELSDAAETNFALEARIRAIELELLAKSNPPPAKKKRGGQR